MEDLRLCSKEQEELVLKNQGFVHYLINKYGISYTDYEDLVSIGTLGLIKAAATFDKSKNIKFTSYAARCILNEIFFTYRKEKFHINDVYLDDPLNVDDDGHKLTWCDVLPSSDTDFTEDYEATDTFIEYISIILNILNPRNRLIMLYKISGVDQRSIAKILGISQSYVSRIEKKACQKVKSYYKTAIPFEEVFSLDIVGNFYEISFSSEDVKNFNLIWANYLENLPSNKCPPNLQVTYDNQRIVIRTPAYLEYFFYIAKIFQEIDNYSL